jgi:hypothetical protein
MIIIQTRSLAANASRWAYGTSKENRIDLDRSRIRLFSSGDKNAPTKPHPQNISVIFDGCDSASLRAHRDRNASSNLGLSNISIDAHAQTSIPHASASPDPRPPDTIVVLTT